MGHVRSLVGVDFAILQFRARETSFFGDFDYLCFDSVDFNSNLAVSDLW